jgi:hypothetical protein
MDPREAALFDIVPKKVDELLSELAALRRREKGGEAVRVPFVTLHLRTGRNFTGRVIKLADDKRGGQTVLFQDTGLDLRSPRYDVVHFASTLVEAITVHDAHTLETPPSSVLRGPTPSKLELKRKIVALEQDLSGRMEGASLSIEIMWDTVPDSEDALVVVQDLVGETEHVLRDLLADPMGLEAIRQKLRKVAIQVGAHASSKMTGTTLTLVTSASWNDRLSKDVLRSGLEKGL